MDTAPNANKKKSRPPSHSSIKTPKRSKTLKTGKIEQPYDLPNQPALKKNEGTTSDT
ncbi:hypothetical protein PC129_g25407 [Phytophthora cactorum]|uniref:Uncharacterized protein n=1 Tax=Phytophthora cactorum TaxID=29920 RepID=A0A329RA53_9STRA|nr:hypothetical protein PC115_g25027 [Phytophthora cactorum]KAG3180931.1 hypothetical protein PC129_g25407 [Phytophthora cactorum]RAW21310.1 hypothetical protein PC110_g22247 [Phytophthora cactorum]